MSKGNMAGLYDHCMFSRIGNCQLVWVSMDFYIPSGNVWVLQFLHILVRVVLSQVFILVTLIGLYWYPIWVLIYIFLMAKDVENLLGYLFAVSVSSKVDYELMTFAHFLTEFLFAQLSFKCLLCVLRR